MQKSKLLNFISKYYLNGSVDSLKLTSDGSELKCGFVTDDKSNIGFVTANLDFPACEIAIYTTGELLKMLGVLSDDVTIQIAEKDGKSVTLRATDKKSLITYMLADMSIIDETPAPTNIPDFEINLKITNEFIDQYLKSKSAIKDAAVFAIASNGQSTKLVMNYSKDNVNNVAFAVNAVDDKHVATEPLCFSAGFFGEILSANKDAKSATFMISTQGLAKVAFETPGEYKAEYYLMQLQIK